MVVPFENFGGEDGGGSAQPASNRLQTQGQTTQQLVSGGIGQHAHPSRPSYKSPYPISEPFGSHTLARKDSRAEFPASTARQRRQSREGSYSQYDNDDGDDDIFDHDDRDMSDLDGNEDDDREIIEFQKSLKKFANEVKDFRGSQRNVDDDDEGFGDIPGFSQPRNRRKIVGKQSATRARGGHRGPRKAAEPTPDIKRRLGEATTAFTDGMYLECRDLAFEIVRLNAETYEAWNLLAVAFVELGEFHNAVLARVMGATLRPKVASAWNSCATFILEGCEEEHRKQYLSTVRMCYGLAIRADLQNLEARVGKAAVEIELNHIASAISDYKFLLRSYPLNTAFVRQLAECHVDLGEYDEARTLYQETIAKFKESKGDTQHSFDWSDADSYMTLYTAHNQYETAIEELKSVARWLLGRGGDDEKYWDTVTSDDREWDLDHERRKLCYYFTPGKYPLKTYGAGLPIELRIKLGIFRLHIGNYKEATHHFNWLKLEKYKPADYPDLFRTVGDKLHDAGLYQQALDFYEALASVVGQADAGLQVQMGKCCIATRMIKEAEVYFQTAIDIDYRNVPARLELARLYEELDEHEEALKVVRRIIAIEKGHAERPSRRARSLKKREERVREESPKLIRAPKMRRSKPRRLADPDERRKEEASIAGYLHDQYSTVLKERGHMREGNSDATVLWMDAAEDLIDDFRGFKLFYPWEKYMRFIGYTGTSRRQAETPLELDMAAMADRLTQHLGTEPADTATSTADIPADYRGISFQDWLDVFLEYAICLARQGRRNESYEICEAARDANVYYHNREDMFLIHVCYSVCTLLSNDEEKLVVVARFFTKEYQFTTDSYRIFAALTRMCQSPISWYMSGPTQKYILRQIKAMDHNLVDEASRNSKFFVDRGSLTARNALGQLVVNTDMDIALLMLYGHILYCGNSYAYSLNYFLRARALNPTNPVINLSIGLAYLHHALKRQADNRQHLVLQGTTFLFDYYNIRKVSSKIEERQEAHYNMARAYHMLGITHLAITYYTRVINEIGGLGGTREDLVVDAAYNLQVMYAMAGNDKAAHSIARHFMVV